MTPSGEHKTSALESAVDWLSNESHPMSFSGCFMSIGMYVNIFGDEIHIEGFDAEKLAKEKRYGNK